MNLCFTESSPSCHPNGTLNILRILSKFLNESISNIHTRHYLVIPVPFLILFALSLSHISHSPLFLLLFSLLLHPPSFPSLPLPCSPLSLSSLLPPSPLSSFQVSEPTAELLYDAKAKIGEGPFYEPQTNQLLWVDIVGHSINFLDVDKKENRYNIYRISFISSRP